MNKDLLEFSELQKLIEILRSNLPLPTDKHHQTVGKYMLKAYYLGKNHDKQKLTLVQKKED